ncbi:MAG: histidinol-phosphate transaminase [Deltaproteobacteria bacterium]|nr:histidinol-phosphate transaminase [Deltaproteobacteria bacterium]
MIKARNRIANMSGYTPGEQPKRGERVIKLNTNENPYPPSPRVLDVFRNLDADDLLRYPDPVANAFRDAAAALYGVAREQIIAGNGSDDILNIVLRTYLNPGDVLAYPDPTYSLYPVLAGLQDAKVAPVAWETGWTLPVEALLASGARVIFVAHPNAPSGTPVALEALDVLASRFDGLLLIDEAYAEFAEHNALPLLSTHNNVLISRTLSKSYSLAGLRFGYGIGHTSIIDELMKVKDSYNCDMPSIAAATAALTDQTYARTVWAQVRAEREQLIPALRGRGWDVIPSQANFVFARPPTGDGAALYAKLKSKGVLVRFFNVPGLTDRIRITVGTPEQMRALLSAIDG